MIRYELASEKFRLRHRAIESPISLLALIVVKPVSDPTVYASRLRGVLAGALDIASSNDFERDEISTDTLPTWFLDLTTGESGGLIGDSDTSEGKERYLETRDARPWDSGDWIYCFDPELRTWSWWDITIDEHKNVYIWLDTKGEVHIPCEELWWLIFLSGAKEVQSMILESASIWHQQISILAAP